MPRDKEDLNEIFAFVKGDVESLEGNAVSIEVKDSNRPDIWAVEGMARALRGYLGVGRTKEIRLAGRSNLKVVIDKRVKPIRPFISTAIVKGLQPTDEALKSWINLQEKLDQTYGRKRRRASIGFYQADLIQSPLSYTVANPDIITFAPLGSENKQSLRDIVENHPKGAEYGEIISQFETWPILVDGADNVLSLPPVINSNDLGRITTETKNILIEVTGTNAETVHNTLKIVVSTLAERGGKIYSCLEIYPYGSPRRFVSPDLSPTRAQLRLSYINTLLGTSLTLKEASRLAERAGYRVRIATGDTIQLEISCYRTDIMHSVDIIEDIAIAMDINKLKPVWPKIWTVGNFAKETDETESVGETMIGLGFQEVLTYALTSPAVVSNNVQSIDGKLVELLNPRMTTHTVVRSWLLPSLLEILSHNTHVDYPQRIFEIGPYISRGENLIHPIQESRKLAAVTIHANAGFTEIRSSFDALAQNKGRSFQIKETEHPSFLSGRCGAITSDGTEVGVIGELNPRVIKSWGLNLPAAAFEMEMSALSLT
ncbi:phenylalanine--tRNA ligase subunit beta [Candidatus Bathyarchaeota archaeon]|nr:MAG: phenylalanine--tRNA ligase subunit beta [Candidatus Bathyarchaeota archaeon]TMI76386.1 MAG: phenylalanine--tRNA ligase subunit beta [Candidatus Bathyarchaeota archaeon]